jgi:hypothetical protein
MSKEHMKLWESVCVTDPDQVKPITGKQYKGNSPKPYWIVKRLTETFGPCGIGWGFAILGERMERLSETDVLSIATVRLWYTHDGKRGELEQIGQTKAAYLKSDGSAMVIDEDAPKKSVTDALVKCASYLGFAGDIFSGMWDDSKYVAWAAEQYAPPPQKVSPDAMAMYIESFKSAKTLAALKQAGDKACAVADAMGDTEARELLGNAYVAKKKTLTNKEPA